MIESVIEVLVVRYQLDRSWEDLGSWISLIGLVVAGILFFSDADRLAVKLFRSDVDYQKFLQNMMIVVSVLAFIALTARWYFRYADGASL